jgi:hypothetical protein
MQLRVFLDETGIHQDAPVTAIAAYFAHPKRWEKFERRWLETLAAFHLKQFHMSEYVHSRGAFEGWTKEKHLALATKLFPIIPEYARWGVAVAMVKAEFDEGLRGYPKTREALGDPYGCCFNWLISIVLERIQEMGREVRLEFIHEDNDYTATAQETWKAICQRDTYKQLASFSFAPKSEFVGLQAADVFAWEAQKRLAEPERPERKSLSALRSKKSIELQFINRQWLKDNAERLAKFVESGGPG